MRIFLFGLGVGVAVGLLIAPREGSESQARLADSVRNWWRTLQGGVGQAGEKRAPGGGADVWEQVREQQTGPQRQVAEEAERESEAVAEVLNTATKDELMSVPGIGPATAKQIIRNRPYESEEEALQEGVLPEVKVERVKEELVEKKREKAS